MRRKKYYELMPCPFCGGKAYLERRHRAFIDGETTLVTFVRCSVCNARSGRQKLLDYGESKNHSEAAEQVAVDSWNKREGVSSCATVRND